MILASCYIMAASPGSTFCLVDHVLMNRLEYFLDRYDTELNDEVDGGIIKLGN